MPKLVEDPNFSRDVGGERRVDFHYQKSSQYRTIHVDGAFGSTTAKGFLALTLFNERPAIPRRSSRPVIGDTEHSVRLGEETVEETLGGVMRQLEATIMMDLNTVRDLYTWLGQHVGLMETLFNVPAESRMGPPLTEEDEQ